MPPAPGQLAVLAGVLDHDRLRLLAVVERCVGERQADRQRGDRCEDPDAVTDGSRADPQRRCCQQGNRPRDQEREAEGVADGADEHVVGALGHLAVRAALLALVAAAVVGERLPQARARTLRLDAAEQRGRERELVLRREPRVEHERDALLLRALGHDVEAVCEQRRERDQHERDAAVADRQQPRGVTRRALRQQLARERRQRHPHADAGERLRHERPGDGRARKPREREHAAADEQAAGERAGARLPGHLCAHERGERQHRDGRRSRQRLDCPPGDQQQYEAEQDGRERAGHERQRDAVGHARRSGGWRW